MTRIAVARAVSIAGHPVVLLPAAALIAASTRGASLQQLRFIGGALVMLGVIALAFSWFQVGTGRWVHIDASRRGERTSLNVFLAVLLLLSALLLWMLTRRPPMSIGLALSSALVATALLIARWVKVSLHAAFAVFATTLVWPITLAVIAGVVITAVVVWSRLVLGRHVAADIVAGVLLGVAAGQGYQLWVV
jgi:membrane-associated phospholipid phosphatase